MPPKRTKAGGALLDELLVVLDVDGVTRRGVTDAAEPAVIDGVKALLREADKVGVNAHVAFVSGTPSVLHHPDLPDWFGGNAPLAAVFNDSFIEEMRDDRVSIYGQLGADRLVLPKGKMTLAGQQHLGFTHVQQVDTFAELIRLYHIDLELTSRDAFQKVAGIAPDCLAAAHAAAVHADAHATPATKFATRPPVELEPWVLAVRKHFDPLFRLVSNGATIEYHDFATRGVTPHSQLQVHGHASSGIAHREGKAFRFVIVTVTNKGETVQKLVDERRSRIAARRGGGPHDHELEVITVGDTAIDYPMHALASTPFHVGIPAVWDAHDSAEVAHVALVTRKDGTAPLVDGTVMVLSALSAAMVSGGGAEGEKGGFDPSRLSRELGPHLMIRETLVD